MVLGELYLPLSLRGDEKNIGGHQKKEEILETPGEKKSSTFSSICQLYGMRRFLFF
jgi:hypothetical protein